jgi:hypothetical protein
MNNVFSPELMNKIVEEWNAALTVGPVDSLESEPCEPMDGDEVSLLISILQNELDFHQGNLTEEELNSVM